jgi:hypothetical protein
LVLNGGSFAMDKSELLRHLTGLDLGM